MAPGKVFYFQPGHEAYPTYHDPHVTRVLQNAVKWAHNPSSRLVDVTDAPNRPTVAAPETIEERGPKLHKPGEAGLR